MAKLNEKMMLTFKKIIDSENIDFLDKQLYIHLTCNIGLSSHTNINGFKNHFKNNDFNKFIRLFQCFSIFCIGEHKDINEKFKNITINKYGEYIHNET